MGLQFLQKALWCAYFRGWQLWEGEREGGEGGRIMNFALRFSMSFVIGQTDYFSFGFTTLNRKSLHDKTFQTTIALFAYNIKVTYLAAGRFQVLTLESIDAVISQRESGLKV